MSIKMDKLPFVSFIIPVYNAEKYLEKCLKSITIQNYPKNKTEIIIIDGGSNDSTIKISKKYGAIILDNHKKDAESGKFIGISHSKGEIIVIIDSDNEIVQSDWLIKMTTPLILDKDIIGVESQYLIKNDFSIFNRYFAIIKIADPLARLLASKPIIGYDHNYSTLNYKKNDNPIIGANGFLWRKSMILSILSINGNCKEFKESSIASLAIENGFTKFASIKDIGIYHYYSDSFGDFIKKRIKIGNKFLNRKKDKNYWLYKINKIRFILVIFYCISILCPTLEAIYQFIKTKEISWFLHPIMSFVTILIYGKIYLTNKLRLIIK